MYQTVGHSGLATLAQALELPFFKRTITGQAIHVGGDYGDRKAKIPGGTTGDETEDLYELLKDVKVRRRGPRRQYHYGGKLTKHTHRKRCRKCKESPLAPSCRIISAFGWSMCEGPGAKRRQAGEGLT
jgi:diphthine-ammonia ligase